MDILIKNKDSAGIIEYFVEQIGGDAKNDMKSTYEELKVLLNKMVSEVTAKISDLNKLVLQQSVQSCEGSLLLEAKNIQCFEPRGRFDLKVSSDMMILEGKQFSVVVPIENISQLICIPSFMSAKREGEDYLAFKLFNAVSVNGKGSTQLLLNLAKNKNSTLITSCVDISQSIDESSAVRSALSKVTKKTISIPNPALFSSIRDQKPYLKCYRGTQEGAIYPLRCGVVFVKPLLFIPLEEIASLTAGRGGCGSTRYVDLIVSGPKIVLYTDEQLY